MAKSFTLDELIFLYECCFEKLEDLDDGHLRSVRPQVAKLHTLMAKLTHEMSKHPPGT